MRTLARLLFVIAALVYGAMPMTGMAGMLPVSAMNMPSDADGMAHVTVANQVSDATTGIDCPHAASSPDRMGTDIGHKDTDSKAMDHTGCGFCPACLMLPVSLAIADGGPPARAAEAAALPRAMLSRMTAPLTPPPRV